MIAGHCTGSEHCKLPYKSCARLQNHNVAHARITCVKFVRSSITWQQSCLLGLSANLVKLLEIRSTIFAIGGQERFAHSLDSVEIGLIIYGRFLQCYTLHCLHVYEFIGQNHKITFLRYFTNVSVHKFFLIFFSGLFDP